MPEQGHLTCFAATTSNARILGGSSIRSASPHHIFSRAPIVVPITLICDRCHTMVGRGCGTIGAANEGTHYEDDSRLFTEHERNDVGTGRFVM
jgi:hypothetical protein